MPVRLPREDHFARYCGFQKIRRDPETDEIIGIFPQALHLRPEKNEKYLSGDWLEHYIGGPFTRLKAVVEGLRNVMGKVGSSSAIALLNVGVVQDIGTQSSRELEALHKYQKRRSGYAGVYGLPEDNSDGELLDLLVRDACVKIYVVAEIDAAEPEPTPI